MVTESFASALRSSNPFWNTNAENKGGVGHFRLFVPKLVATVPSFERSEKRRLYLHMYPRVCQS